MDYALLAIGILIIAALGWVVTALYELKDRAVSHTDHLNALQRQIAALPAPEAPDMSRLDEVHRAVSALQPAPLPDLSALEHMKAALGEVHKLVARKPERVPQTLVERVARVERIKKGRDLLRQRLAERNAVS